MVVPQVIVGCIQQGNRHNLKRIHGGSHIDVQYVYVGGSLLMLDVQTSDIQQVVSLQEPAELLCSCSSQEAGLLAVGMHPSPQHPVR